MSAMKNRRLGDRITSAIGLGGAKLSLREDRPSEAQSVRTLHAAWTAGCSLVDTSDIYALNAEDTGHNERLIRHAIDSWDGDRSSITIATKGGQWWDGATPRFTGGHDYLRSACEASRRALDVDQIDLYLLHRLPADYSPTGARAGDDFLESLETLAALRDEGKVAAIGLSNVDAAMLRTALEFGPVAAIENPLNVLVPPPADQIELCAEYDVAFLGWGSLRGTLAADASSSPSPVTSRLLAILTDIAAAHGVSLQVATLAWELGISSDIIPLVGARRPESILASLSAVELTLTEHESERLAAALL